MEYGKGWQKGAMQWPNKMGKKKGALPWMESLRGARQQPDIMEDKGVHHLVWKVHATMNKVLVSPTNRISLLAIEGALGEAQVEGKIEGPLPSTESPSIDE